MCPRCGAKAGDSVWCDSCGLNLKQQKDLPTADVYAARVREREWKDAQKSGPPARKVRRKGSPGQKGPGRDHEAGTDAAGSRPRKALTIGVAIVALLAGAAAAWHFTGWDAPLVGTSPIKDDDEQSATAADSGEASEDSPADSIDTVIVPGQSIGPVSLGASQQDVESELGSGRQPDPGVPQFEYEVLGGILGVSFEAGRVISVSTESPTFTLEGVDTSSGFEAVSSALPSWDSEACGDGSGEVQMSETPQGPTTVWTFFSGPGEGRAHIEILEGGPLDSICSGE